MLTDLWCPVKLVLEQPQYLRQSWSLPLKFLEQPVPTVGQAGRVCQKCCCFKEFHVKLCETRMWLRDEKIASLAEGA